MVSKSSVDTWKHILGRFDACRVVRRSVAKALGRFARLGCCACKKALGLSKRLRDAVAWKDSRLIAPQIKYPLANKSA